MRNVLNTLQVIAKSCKPLIIEKYVIAKVISQPKRDNNQNGIKQNHSNTFEDAPLTSMRTASGDGFSNRASYSARRIRITGLCSLRILIDCMHIVCCL